MTRYLRLYLYFLRFSFSKALEFRIDFGFRIVMDIIYYAVNILFFKVIYLHTPFVAGWREDEIMVFVASYLLIDAIIMTVFSANMWWLPFYINRGDLDFYLIRPVRPLFFLSLRDFSASSFVNLLIAVGFFVYSLMSYAGAIDPLDFLIYIILLLNGVLLCYVLQMLMIIPVFWTHSRRGFMDLFYSISLALERPHQIYRGWMKILFTSILPFALIASYPATLLFRGWNATDLLHLGVITIAAWVVMLLFWRIGLRSYSSASS
jgi:ABC-2 type transport system permease protein